MFAVLEDNCFLPEGEFSDTDLFKVIDFDDFSCETVSGKKLKYAIDKLGDTLFINAYKDNDEDYGISYNLDDSMLDGYLHYHAQYGNKDILTIDAIGTETNDFIVHFNQFNTQTKICFSCDYSTIYINDKHSIDLRLFENEEYIVYLNSIYSIGLNIFKITLELSESTDTRSGYIFLYVDADTGNVFYGRCSDAYSNEVFELQLMTELVFSRFDITLRDIETSFKLPSLRGFISKCKTMKNIVVE